MMLYGAMLELGYSMYIKYPESLGYDPRHDYLSAVRCPPSYQYTIPMSQLTRILPMYGSLRLSFYARGSYRSGARR